ncbi:hypothetical protein EN781_09735 [Mesorhizobium sp. M4A.F.Ca.ET.090.04.2.1]|uniref:hypothetical protein n=1 Tax=Mesorhizobium sp. M4A.F.Ca.ET.090.04.2.1 TaxID=2496663 RepID=UPI000FCCDB33|nr:hypothetical protein [Mesorhizobium sp. M4A.F.Ca.ET.090.04.2.1]RVC45467.1 hypothetical protein EN781_09735 [Mesorhizobium sp. M4A.F.Ca.ET.090.04.2.1]
MIAAQQPANLNDPAESFNPAARHSEVPKKARSGKHRKFSAKPSRNWLWPKTREEQRKAFRAWQFIAKQIIHKERYSFQAISTFDQFLFWGKGEIYASNEEMAEAAGKCSARKISREISAYRDMGIIAVDMGWRKSQDGKFKSTRTIRLAVPRDFDPDISIELAEYHHVHGGRDGGGK